MEKDPIRLISPIILIVFLTPGYLYLFRKFPKFFKSLILTQNMTEVIHQTLLILPVTQIRISKLGNFTRKLVAEINIYM